MGEHRERRERSSAVERADRSASRGRPSGAGDGTPADIQPAPRRWTIEADLREAAVQLRAEPGSPRLARLFVVERLDGWGSGDRLEVVKLLTSELVTNAILHAGTDVEVVLRSGPTWVRVEVHDADERAPALREYDDDTLGGRGLALVRSFSDRWGVEPRTAGTGKAVWFELSA